MVVRKEREKWRVLLVEDDADLRKLITRMLEQAKLEVLAAADGQLGLQLAADRKPHLIISDVMMPNMDGIEMVRTLKSDPAWKQVPVIFLTAKETPKDVIEGIRAGARHYITKPFSMPELMQKVRAILPEVPE